MRRDNDAARAGMTGAALLMAATILTACAERTAAPAAPRSTPSEAAPPAIAEAAPVQVQTEADEQKPAMTQAKVTEPPFTLTAAIARDESESQPVLLTLDLRNDGAQSRMIGGSAFEQSAFRIAITNNKGRTVPRTAEGDRVLTPPMAVSANMEEAIGPEQTFHYRFNLARLFDLSRAGSYSVSVSRSVSTSTQLFMPFTRPAGRPASPPQPKLPQLVNLALGPLPFRMSSDQASVSGVTTPVPTPGDKAFLYVTSPYKPGIARYRVGDDGGVSLAVASKPPDPPPVTEETYGTGFGVPVAMPDGRFLYCPASDHTIARFRVGDDGVLSPLSSVSVPNSSLNDTLLMDSKGRFLYSLPGGAFAIGPDGQLTSLTMTMPIGLDSPGSCAIDGTGSHLYVSNGLTYGYRIDGNGRLTALPVPRSKQGVAGSMTGRDSAVALSPSGQFAYIGVSTQGYSAGFDLVMPMRVAADGALTQIPGGARVPQSPVYPPGTMTSGCSSLAVDPSGRFLLAGSSGYSDAFRIEADGTLTPLGMTLVQGGLGSVFFVPNHPTAYALSSDSLLAFRLDPQRGLVPAGLDMEGDMPFQAGVAAAVAPVPDQWGAAEGGLEVAARVPADDVAAGRPIIMTVTLRNTTDHPLSLGPAGADMTALHLSVTGPQSQYFGLLSQGKEPATTPGSLLAAGRDLFGTARKDGATVVLPARGERAYSLVLTRCFDMTVAGNYTVQVTRSLPSGGEANSPVIPLLLEGRIDDVNRHLPGSGAWQGVDVP